MLAAALCAGCRPKSKPEPVATTIAPVVQPAEDVGSAGAPDEAAPDALAHAGTCSDDEACTGYHRCEAGRCVVPPAVDGRIVEGMASARFLDGETELGKVMLEVADEKAEQMRGLMYRRQMHRDFGMLFIFDEDEERSFWMKNTLISLDMVHINSRGLVVGVIENVEPLTLTPRQTGHPARYVLELVAGRVAELGIRPGTKMVLDGVPDDLSPSE